MLIGILGPLKIDDGLTERMISAPRQRAIVACLVLRKNQYVSADALCDRVWNGQPPDGCRKTLHSYLVRLRASLGPAVGARLVTRESGYVLQIGEGELDADLFQASCVEAFAASGREDWPAACDGFIRALELWRGEVLEDLGDLQVRAEAAHRWDELRLRALEGRFTAELHLGRHEAIVAEVAEAVGANPLRERFVGQLMLALHRGGRRAEALEVYRRAYRTLSHESGMEPGSELRDIQRQILASGRAAVARPPTAAPAVTDAPPPIGSWRGFGRAASLPAGARHGSEPEVKPLVCVVTGPGGSGKTTLAAHLAEAVTAAFPSHCLSADLRAGSGQPADPYDVQEAFLRQLGVGADGIPAARWHRAGRYQDVAGARKLFILLDDAADAEQVRPLLPVRGRCVVLVTSRSQLAELEPRRVADLGQLCLAEARDFLEQVIVEAASARARELVGESLPDGSRSRPRAGYGPVAAG